MKKIFLLISLSLVIFGCDTEKVVKNRHEASPQPEALGVEVSKQLKNYDSESVNDLARDLIEATRNGTAGDYMGLMEQARSYVVNSEKVASPEALEDDSLIRLLTAYNLGLLRMVGENHASVTSTDLNQNWLHEYVNLLKIGCGENLTECQTVNFFKTDTYSYKVVYHYIRLRLTSFGDEPTPEENKELLNLFAFSLELRKGPDSELDLLFLRHSSKLISYLETGSRQEQASRTKFVRVVKLLLEWLDPSKTNSDDFQQFLIDFKPWSYSQKTNSDLGFAAQKLFELSTEILLQDPEIVASTFRDEITRIREKEQDIAGTYFYREKEFQGAELKALAQGIQFTSIKPQDDVNLFIIDRLFSGHLSIADVTSIWQQIPKPTVDGKTAQTRLLETANSYLKIRIAALSAQTTKNLANLFFEFDESRVDRLQNVLRKSHTLTREWSRFLDRVNFVKNFLESNLKAGRWSTQEYLKTERNITVLSENIKFFLTYPNMMIYSYLLRGREVEGLSTWFDQDVKVDDASILRMFKGSEGMWFRFGGDESSINKIQALFSVYYMMNFATVNIFSSVYDEKASSSFSETYFYSYLIEKLLFSIKSSMIADRNSLRNQVNDVKFLEFRRECRRFEGQQKIQISKYLEDLNQFALFDIAKPLVNFYAQDSSAGVTGADVNNLILELRAIVVEREMVVRLVTHMYEKTLENLASNGIISDTLKESKFSTFSTLIQNQMNEVDSLKREINSYISQHNKLADTCLRQFFEKEFQVQEYINDYFEKYFTKVYFELARRRGKDEAFFQELQSQGVTEPEISLDVSGPGGYSGYEGRINEQQYSLHKIDLLLTLKKVLENGGQSLNIGSTDLKYTIDMPVDFTRIKLIENPNSNDIQLIPWSENYEQFIKSAFRALYWSEGSGTSKKYMLGWVYGIEDINFVKNRFDVLLEQYVTGQLDEYDRQCNKREITQCAKKSYEITADELVHDYLSWIELLHMDEKDLALYQRIEKLSKFDQAVILKMFFADNNVNKPLTFFDNYFLTLRGHVFPKLDVKFNNALKNGIMATVHFYEAQRDLLDFFFNPPDYLISELRKEYMHFTYGLLDKTRSFKVAIDKLEEEMGSVQAFRFETARDPIESKSRSGNIELIDSEEIEDFKKYVDKNFYQRTLNFYSVGQGESYFTDYKPIECFYREGAPGCTE